MDGAGEHEGPSPPLVGGVMHHVRAVTRDSAVAPPAPLALSMSACGSGPSSPSGSRVQLRCGIHPAPDNRAAGDPLARARCPVECRSAHGAAEPNLLQRGSRWITIPRLMSVRDASVPVPTGDARRSLVWQEVLPVTLFSKWRIAPRVGGVLRERAHLARTRDATCAARSILHSKLPRPLVVRLGRLARGRRRVSSATAGGSRSQ